MLPGEAERKEAPGRVFSSASARETRHTEGRIQPQRAEDDIAKLKLAAKVTEIKSFLRSWQERV